MLIIVVPLVVGGLIIFLLLKVFARKPALDPPAVHVRDFQPSTPRSSHYALTYPPPGTVGSPFANSPPSGSVTPPRKLSSGVQPVRSGSHLVPSTPRSGSTLVPSTPRGVPSTPRGTLRTSLTTDGAPMTPRRTAGSFLGEMRSPRVIELPSDMPTVLRPMTGKKKKNRQSESKSTESSSDEEEPASAPAPSLMTTSVTTPLPLMPEKESPAAAEASARRAELELEKRRLRLSEQQLNSSGLSEVLMSPRAQVATTASFDELWQQREQTERRAAEERAAIEKLKQAVASATVDSPQRQALLEQEQRRAHLAAEQRAAEELGQKTEREEARRQQLDAEERERVVIAERARQMADEERERAMFAERQRQMVEEERERAAMELRRKLLEEEAHERTLLEARRSADHTAGSRLDVAPAVDFTPTDDEMIVHEDHPHPEISVVIQSKPKRKGKKGSRALLANDAGSTAESKSAKSTTSSLPVEAFSRASALSPSAGTSPTAPFKPQNDTLVDSIGSSNVERLVELPVLPVSHVQMPNHLLYWIALHVSPPKMPHNTQEPDELCTTQLMRRYDAIASSLFALEQQLSVLEQKPGV